VAGLRDVSGSEPTVVWMAPTADSRVRTDDRVRRAVQAPAEAGTYGADMSLAATTVADAVRRHAPALTLAALLATSGTIHLVRPAVFRPLIPRSLGAPDPWVLSSGVAELACAGALAVPATRSAGGWASAALLVAVFPGNVTMAVRSRADAVAWAGRPVVAWSRLPLQAPLIAWAVAVARHAGSRPHDLANARVSGGLGR
jgi:uncharacterized membrane protein